MPISSRSVVSFTIIFLAIGFLALLGIVGTTLVLGERAQVYFTEVVTARDQRSAVVEMRNALTGTEASQRGFMVSGNEIYLAPYDLAKSDVQRHLGNIRRLFAAHTEVLPSVERLEAISAAKISEMDEVITLVRARHMDEALAIFRTNKGKALMDEANVYFASLIDGTDDRLLQGMSEQQSNAFWLRLISGLGAIVIVAVVASAVFVIVRYTLELSAVRDEVTGLNADLERRVSDRTLDLVVARDRATMLLAEVNHRIANSLALVSSLVGLQAKAVKDDIAKGALAETQDRIFAVSLVHKRLYSSSAVGSVDLQDYLSALLEHLKTSLRSEGQGVDLSYEIAAVSLPTDKSINLGVVVTEWVTNAFKYAYPDGVGEVRVSVQEAADGTVDLVVADDGVGRAEGVPAKGTGLGSRIVTAMAASMKANVEYRNSQPGMAAHLSFSPSA